MTDIQNIKRRIFLRRQAVFLMRREVERLRLELSLVKLKSFFEKQVDHAKDQQGLLNCLSMINDLLQAVKEGY